MSKSLNITILLFVVLPALHAQTTANNSHVQVSGTISDETGRFVPGVAVISHKLKQGVFSEPTGVFSITSLPGDTISFRLLGYKKYHTIIPFDYTSRVASVNIMLEFDTVQIESVNIIPWNTYSGFIREIAQEKPVAPTIENMNANMASIYVAAKYGGDLPIDPYTAYRRTMGQNYIGGFNINPISLAKFIQGIMTGELFIDNRPKEAKVLKKIPNSEKK